MKPGDQPELLLQIGKSKVLAKGIDAVDVVTAARVRADAGISAARHRRTRSPPAGMARR